MALLFVVGAGIVVAIVVAAVLAALATAVFGAALAVVSLPYAIVKRRFRKGEAPLAEEPLPPQPTLALEPQPVLASRSGPGWLKPIVTVVAWASLSAVVDSALRK